MRTPMPCLTVTTALEAALWVSAVTSHIEFAHSELPETAPATPNCCCWPAAQPRSSELLRLSASFLIGFTLTQLGCGTSVVVYSGVPSPVTSAHRVFDPEHGLITAFAGSA